VRRDYADCDDIGPLDDFKQAEDIILRLCIALTEFEEKLWRVSAALVIKGYTILDDGTANQLDDGPDVPDGHDCEGFPGGCARMGCPGGDNCTDLKVVR
jgi:hypothetical protein